MDVTSIGLAGALAAQSSFARSATNIATASNGAAAPQDKVDLSTSAVNMLQAKNDFDANLATVKAGDDMTRTAIDMLA